MKRHQINPILEDVRSALNVGAMFRTSDAALVEKLYLAGITPYPPHNRIPKTALGAIDSVPWVYQKDKQLLIDTLASEMPIIAVELTPEAIDYSEFQFPERLAVVFGNEISGVSEYSLSKATTTVKIPMYGIKESLNVATTFGIILFEILRQWKGMGII